MKTKDSLFFLLLMFLLFSCQENKDEEGDTIQENYFKAGSFETKVKTIDYFVDPYSAETDFDDVFIIEADGLTIDKQCFKNCSDNCLTGTGASAIIYIAGSFSSKTPTGMFALHGETSETQEFNMVYDLTTDSTGFGDYDENGGGVIDPYLVVGELSISEKKNDVYEVTIKGITNTNEDVDVFYSGVINYILLDCQ